CRHRREHLRKPLHARAGTAPHGRRHRHRRPHRRGARRGAPVRRRGHGDRPARLGQPGDRRPGRRGPDPGGPHLPPRSRLRQNGSQAALAGRRHPAPDRQGSLMTAAPITLALSKGRIFEETLPLLAEVGIHVAENPESSRKLILPTSDPALRLIIVRASDVPTYVQYGAADLGIAGKDVLIEHAAQQPGGLYQPIDLDIAKCRLCVAVRNGFDYQAAVHQGARLRVATKYVQSAREHFAAKGVYVDIIKLYGSMELAPLVGLADCIVDLVSSGGTLRANDLVAVEDIKDISSRLIVDRKR